MDSRCKKHTKEFAIQRWQENGYPEIDWEGLRDRFLKRSIMISGIIAGADCHFRRRHQRVVVERVDRFVNSADNLPVPGYYGMKGFEIMSDMIMEEFANEFRLMMQDDDLMRIRGVTTFSHYVVLPEIAVDFIMEDMKVNWDDAIAIMEESVEVGLEVNSDWD